MDDVYVLRSLLDECRNSISATQHELNEARLEIEGLKRALYLVKQRSDEFAAVSAELFSTIAEGQ